MTSLSFQAIIPARRSDRAMVDDRCIPPSHSRWFMTLWFFIVSVSVHDAYLVVANRSAMLHNELNPLGRWLVQCNGGDVWLLLTVKATGTLVAATLMLFLFWTNRRVAWIACASVAGLHLVLLLWLYLA